MFSKMIIKTTIQFQNLEQTHRWLIHSTASSVTQSSLRDYSCYHFPKFRVRLTYDLSIILYSTRHSLGWGVQGLYIHIFIYLIFYGTYGVLRMASLSALKVKDKQNVIHLIYVYYSKPNFTSRLKTQQMCNAYLLLVL